VDLQTRGQGLYFIADLHALTTVRDAARLRELTRDVALNFLALGLDPAKAALFRQSDIPEVAELSWVLSTVTPMGLLERAHSYKDKTARGISADHGLFAYPVLMAADILQYNADVVPVGQDQKQHLEMARDIAGRFNHAYGEDVFKLPEPHILEDVAVVPGVDGRKMSKSYDNVVRMFWPEKKLRKAVMGIVTDSTPVEDPKDTSQALFQLWSLFASKQEREDLFAQARAGGMGYGDVKKALADRVLAFFAPMREKRVELAQRPDDIEDILREGARRARELATPTWQAARHAAGLGS
jgi:tryptophanyl-tRNA synthetase